MGILKRGTVALAVAAMLAAPRLASAQLLSFYTTGAFSGGGCTVSSCTFGGYTLGYTASGTLSSPKLYMAPTTVALGAFTMMGSGGLSTLAGASFTLTIHQLLPGLPANGAFAGSVSGTFKLSPTTSTLVWVPNPNTLTINSLPNFSTTYALKNNYDENGVKGILISDESTSITAKASVAPEPGTFVLLASGLGFVGLAVMRRRKAVNLGA